MPRRKSNVSESILRARPRLPRKGSVITVWNSLGRAVEARVTSANNHTINLIDLDTGEHTWIATRLYRG